MVVDYLPMSSVDFAIPDFCSLIPVGSLRQSRRVRNRRVTPRPCLVMGRRLSGSNRFLLNHGQMFNNPTCQRLAGNFLAGLHWGRQRTAICSFKMISFSNINKQYGKQLLFVDASFQLNPGEKVGLVGPNGSGKTTLFRMVVGEETPD